MLKEGTNHKEEMGNFFHEYKMDDQTLGESSGLKGRGEDGREGEKNI